MDTFSIEHLESKDVHESYKNRLPWQEQTCTDLEREEINREIIRRILKQPILNEMFIHESYL